MIPDLMWRRLTRRLTRRRSKLTPVAVPKPAARLTLWDTPGLFTAWGFANGDWSGAILGAKARDAGFEWVALQVGQFSGADVSGLRGCGLRIALWEIAGDMQTSQAQLAFVQPDGYLLQIEDTSQYQAALAYLRAGVGDGVRDRAVVTTFGGADAPQLVSQLTERVDMALVECYAQDGPPHGDTLRMTWQARNYGWPRAVPVIGLFHGVPLSQYTIRPFGRGFSVWNAESLNQEDWTDIATALR